MEPIALLGALWGPDPLAIDTTSWIFLASAVFAGTSAAWLATRLGRLLAALSKEEKKQNS
jgi:hypothetical protein